MAPDQAAPVPAGWYPDPYSASELRWWDGQNWTDSVHPPVTPPAATPAAAPEPVVSAPTSPEPATPEPVTSAPVTPEPVTSAPVTPEPVTPVPAAPVPAAAEPAPLIEPAPTEVLPSRRELRARTAATADAHSGPAAAPTADAADAAASQPPATVPASAPAPSPAPDSAEPSSSNWLPGGAALGTGAAVSAAPTSGSAGQGLPAPASSSLLATPAASPVTEPAASGSGETGTAPAPNAWAREPVNAAIATDDLYSNAATRKATISGWFIAFMPLFTGILSIAAVKGAENYPRYIPATFEWWMLAGGVVVVLYLVTILLAVADRSKLDWAGYTRPAHWAWAVLTAPVYLLVRTIAVKRETGRNSALLWVWLVLAAALVGAWFAANYFVPELLAPYTLPFV
ncbi:hypothetical protein GCM10022239_23000 [Leifsonia bigeumensis]|uniref:DUF2510 domain-containing protein n=1 Tax=Leifsonella bigeumensis TaxID=433643 RepID=A0ABP7FTG2_9MICO